VVAVDQAYQQEPIASLRPVPAEMLATMAMWIMRRMLGEVGLARQIQPESLATSA
jgi:hypothetical protein